mmetsp:Transcript_21128/g.31321  ORF Transcript_21128/g.31321 Transcript_21128/m.31321 type:complete len:103 (+) Transcript_21128:931-1239(+)
MERLPDNSGDGHEPTNRIARCAIVRSTTHGSKSRLGFRACPTVASFTLISRRGLLFNRLILFGMTAESLWAYCDGQEWTVQLTSEYIRTPYAAPYADTSFDK